MELSFDADRSMLRDTVRRYVEREYTFEQRQRRRTKADGFCRETWAALADLGVLGAALPEEHGGFGAGGIGTLIVAEAFGSALVVEPYLASVVLAAGAIELGGSPAQCAWLPEVAAGRLLLAFAHEEPEMRYDGAVVTTRAEPGGHTWSIRGRKSVVLHAAAADRILVSATVADGLALFVVERGAPGLSLHEYVTPDGLPAADLVLEDVRVSREAAVGPAGHAWLLLDHVLDRATAAVCAEAVGAMDAVLRRTIAYLGTRQQFGMPLARFQALQHRVADMAIEVEQARSMALVAAQYVDDADPDARRRYVSAAKARVGEAAAFVGRQAVQLHGGIGMTDALDVSHYFKRLAMIACTFGDTDHHVDRYLLAAGR